VAEVCRRRGISRQTFYVYQRRFMAEGPAGLEERSRRPKVSPGRLEPLLEAEICSLRRQHPRWGARRIRAELLRGGVEAPAISTVHQAAAQCWSNQGRSGSAYAAAAASRLPASPD
jgi:hypothetical protein